VKEHRILTKDLLENKFREGLTPHQISKLLRIDIRTVLKYMEIYGLSHLRPKRAILGPNPNPNWNCDFFENIDSEDKAYWLGFLMADGCVTTVGGMIPNVVVLLLAEKDKEQIVKWHQAINSDHNIQTYSNVCWQKSSRGEKLDATNYKRCVSQHYSRKMCSDLIRLGCTPRKSNTLKFPNLPPHLIHHFIRGYFDGDGSISWEIRGTQPKIDFCGTKQFLEGVKYHLEVKPKIHDYKHSKAFALRIGGKRQVKRIAEYLYFDATVFMVRKRERFNPLIGEIPAGFLQRQLISG
jgi:hypothetical protein